ncbi:MAG: SDR family NAD(P)-dependent oxidoreductase [PS1 clade bacterium]|uniref:SDR family NAD(P)-dependent oxidoreductase n=1 Tax=PS1 clade bacterium TaxID=2175152 RepID=A0A368E2E8_9PROT|nr:MAG: SDR family NAD(P)-dependent oxidoreductase [PS1 clade bacterium]HAK98398.1 short-chain dehydrogenase [Rhodobiaceae bacterium]|tara:strand:- start:680 stop:1558 length:879 start_codon:yes stop_codon:yes gene_type:complete
MGLCDNRTIIITGAGGGLGRAYAIALGAAGGNIVVNDINPDTAAETVKIINDAGGQAIVNLDDITDYDSAGKILAATIERFGDVHAVVNNAGNNRDRMFTSLSESDWDDVIRVHLKGHFCLSSHAAKYWREKSKNGENPDARIINTSSGAGLQGSVGQTNYAAAKGGILTLTLNQSAELARYGITANSVAPQGRTGMTEEVFADMMKVPEDGSFDKFDPANVAPLIVYLCSPASADINGYCFESFGGKLSIADGYKTGPIKDKEARYEPEEIEAVIRELIEITPPAQKVYGS